MTVIYSEIETADSDGIVGAGAADYLVEVHARNGHESTTMWVGRDAARLLAAELEVMPDLENPENVPERKWPARDPRTTDKLRGQNIALKARNSPGVRIEWAGLSLDSASGKTVTVVLDRMSMLSLAGSLRCAARAAYSTATAE